MSFVDAIKSGFRNYVTFRGRASRSEFWWWTLFAILVQAVTMGVDNTINLIATLGLFLPGIAVNVRRLHDTNRSGWWLIGLVVALAVAIISLSEFAESVALDFANPDDWDPELAFQDASAGMMMVVGLSLLAAFVLGIVNIVFALLKSDPQMNRFGPPPPPKLDRL